MSAADDNMLTNITEVSIYPQKVWGQFNFGTTMILKATLSWLKYKFQEDASSQTQETEKERFEEVQQRQFKPRQPRWENGFETQFCWQKENSLTFSIKHLYLLTTPSQVNIWNTWKVI